MPPHSSDFAVGCRPRSGAWVANAALVCHLSVHWDRSPPLGTPLAIRRCGCAGSAAKLTAVMRTHTATLLPPRNGHGSFDCTSARAAAAGDESSGQSVRCSGRRARIVPRLRVAFSGRPVRPVRMAATVGAVDTTMRCHRGSRSGTPVAASGLRQCAWTASGALTKQQRYELQRTQPPRDSPLAHTSPAGSRTRNGMLGLWLSRRSLHPHTRLPHTAVPARCCARSHTVAST